MRRTILVLVAGCAMAWGADPPPAVAQQAGAADLDRAEELLGEHRYADARAAVRAWWDASGEAARGDLRARGLFLRAVLNTEPASSESDLLRIAVEHPQSPHADRALLRLAQFRLARGDSAEARALLERLVRDHPQGGERDRAIALLRPLGGAVTRPSRSAAPATPSGRPPAAPAAAPQRPSAAPAPSAPGRPAEYRPGVDYTVQAGAFSAVSDAEALRARLRAAGFDAYLARVGGDGRTLVRVGTFRDRAAAEALQRRMRTAGFPGDAVAINLP
jgi:cell division septation protein DedD